MKLNSKVTGGLAWAGLVLILAVPSAEILTKPATVQAGAATEVDSTQTATIRPAAIKAPTPAPRPAGRDVAAAPAANQARGADAVDAFVASGKKLPSYISDAPGAVAVKPAADTPAPTTTQVASTAKPTVRQPAAAKPETTVLAATPRAANSTGTSTATRVILPSGPATGTVDANGTFVDTDPFETASIAPEQGRAPVPYPASKRPKLAVQSSPLIIEEDEVTREQVATRPPEAFDVSEPEPVITGDQLEEWDSGSLADYLARKGLISDSDVAVRELESEFEEDGFFLSDGPRREPRLIGRQREWDLF